MSARELLAEVLEDYRYDLDPGVPVCSACAGSLVELRLGVPPRLREDMVVVHAKREAGRSCNSMASYQDYFSVEAGMLWSTLDSVCFAPLRPGGLFCPSYPHARVAHFGVLTNVFNSHQDPCMRSGVTMGLGVTLSEESVRRLLLDCALSGEEVSP